MSFTKRNMPEEIQPVEQDLYQDEPAPKLKYNVTIEGNSYFELSVKVAALMGIMNKLSRGGDIVVYHQEPGLSFEKI